MGHQLAARFRQSREGYGPKRASNGILHVYAHLAPAKWPKDRVKVFDGFPVMWHRVHTAATNDEQEAHL